jgi:cyanophycin synthetase
MKILDRSVYVGPSLYALFPVIRLDLDLGELEAWPTGRLGTEFLGPLFGLLPGLEEHGCSYGEPGGFRRRCEEGEGTWLGHVLEHLAIELQHRAGEPVTFGKTRSADRPGSYTVVYQYDQADVGIEAGNLALSLIATLLPEAIRPEGPVPPAFQVERELEDFIRYAQRRHLGPSTAALARTAEARGIPWIRLNQHSLIQFGHGVHQQRIQATVTSRTPHIAVELASDKEETNKILANLGLPVPRQRLVRSEAEAVRAAEAVGYPVVVKPYNANHGRGVAIHLTEEAQVRAAFPQAQEHSSSVIIESFITGDDHRMLVVNGQLVAVAKRVPGHVVGDGSHTIEQLVASVNSDPRRGVGHEKVLTRLEFDAQADRLLAQKGYTRDSIPPAGETVFLRSTGNLSTGGTAIDVTDVVHPDNVEMAVRTVKALGLDVGGVTSSRPTSACPTRTTAPPSAR